MVVIPNTTQMLGQAVDTARETGQEEASTSWEEG